MSRKGVLLVLMAVCCAGFLPSYGQGLADPAGWQRDLENWRAARAHAIAARDGWLSLAGLEWLKPGLNALGSAPGAQLRLPATAAARVGLITVSGRTVQLLSPVGGFPAGLTLDGHPAREGVLSTADASPTVIGLGTLTMTVAERAGRFVLCVKDAASPALAGFKGLNWYAPNARRVVLAEWSPYKTPQVAEIPTALGSSLHLTTPGVARFELDGQPVEVEPVVEGKTLLFILRDQTSTSTTYAGGRFLRTQWPDNGLEKAGTVVLDLNRLENPPCAYTQYATCPLAPEKNRLSVAIEAGEKRYAQ